MKRENIFRNQDKTGRGQIEKKEKKQLKTRLRKTGVSMKKREKCKKRKTEKEG